jgi:PglZ domain
MLKTPPKPKNRNLVTLLATRLLAAHSDSPIFWYDPACQFADVIERVRAVLVKEERQLLDVREVKLFDVRLAWDGNDDPLRGYVVYIPAKAPPEPIAELAKCFGRRIEITVAELLAEAGIRCGDADRELVAQHAELLLRFWDRIPHKAWDVGNVSLGLACAIRDLRVADPIEVAFAEVRRIASKPSLLNNDAASDVSEQFVREVLVEELGIRDAAPRALMRRLVAVDFLDTSWGRTACADICEPSAVSYFQGLAARVASDLKIVRKLASGFEEELSKLGMTLDRFDDSDLRRLRLFSRASDIRFARLQQELEGTDVHALLPRLRELLIDPSGDVEWESFVAAAQLDEDIQRETAWIDAESPDFQTYVLAYAERWWRIDRAYRQAMERSNGKLRRALQWKYRSWLSFVNLAFQRRLGDMPTWKWQHAQRDLGEVFAKVPDGTAIVVCDALRYEMAASLSENLDERLQIGRSWCLASLPSITEVGMSALLPSADRIRVDLVPQPDGNRAPLSVFVGDRETTSKTARTKVWKAAGFHVYDADDIANAVPSEKRVIVFHGAIDQAGEKLQNESYEHFRTILDSLKMLLLRLLETFACVIVTADHGFLTLPEESTSIKVIGDPIPDALKKRRYRVGRGLDTLEATLLRSSEDLGMLGSLSFQFPLGDAVFQAPGALTFMHGGISLQELVVPVLTLTHHSRADTMPLATVTFPKALRSQAVSVTLRLGEDAKPSDRVALEVIVEGRTQCLKEQTISEAPMPEGCPSERRLVGALDAMPKVGTIVTVLVRHVGGAVLGRVKLPFEER